MEINHQWSKSVEMEKMFQEYLKPIAPIDYFSMLRPLSELHIALLFTEKPDHILYTTSCNANWKILKTSPSPSGGGGQGERAAFCGLCPKCAFVFALYSAFLDLDVLEKIFGKNMYDDESLIPLYKQLIGMEGFKPFECVGTPEETKAAFLLALDRDGLDAYPVMKMFSEEVLPNIAPEEAEKLITDALTPSNEHLIPDPFSQTINALT